MDFKSIVEAVKASGVVDAKTGRVFGEAFAASLQQDPAVKAAVLAAFAAGSAAVAVATAPVATVVPADEVAMLLARGRAALAANAVNAAAVKAAVEVIEAVINDPVDREVDVTEQYMLLANLPPVPEKAPEVPVPEAPAPAPAPAPAENPAKAARQPAAA